MTSSWLESVEFAVGIIVGSILLAVGLSFISLGIMSRLSLYTLLLGIPCTALGVAIMIAIAADMKSDTKSKPHVPPEEEIRRRAILLGHRDAGAKAESPALDQISTEKNKSEQEQLLEHSIEPVDLREKSETERKYPYVYSAMGGRWAEARLLMDESVLFFNEEKFQEAAQCLHKATEVTPGDSRVWAALSVVLTTAGNCKKASTSLEKTNLLDSESIEAILATNLYDYRCAGKKRIRPTKDDSISNTALPAVLVVPTDGTLIVVRFGKAPRSARNWWGEGLRQMKKGKPNIARIMFQAALIEYQPFTQAWAGLASALRSMDLEEFALAAENRFEYTKRGSKVPNNAWEQVGMISRKYWVDAITLYRIVYGKQIETG